MVREIVDLSTPQLLTDLPHIQPLGVIQQEDLPLLGGHVLFQGTDQIALEAADPPGCCPAAICRVYTAMSAAYTLPLLYRVFGIPAGTPCHSSVR